MYLWNIFKTLIYLLFCSKKYAYSEQQDVEINTSLEPISLNLNNKSSKNNYYYTKTDNSETYTANKGFGFSSVNVSSKFSCKDITIWVAINPYEYANKVVLTSYVYKNLKDLRVFMINGQEKLFIRKYNELWTELVLTKNFFIYLIIETMDDTYSYHTSRNDLFRTFEANFPFLFCKIVSLNSLNVTKRIWNASNNNECAYKVIINYPNTPELTNKIAIFFPNGDIKHFIKSNFKWVEVHPWLVLNISHREPTYEYQYFKHENNVECFIPNVNFLFKAVRVSEPQRVSTMNVEIWRGRDNNLLARMVFYARSAKPVKYLVLILANDEFIVFQRTPKFKMWTDCTNSPNIIQTLRGLGINLEKFQQTKEKIIRSKIKPRKPVQVDYTKWLESLPFLSKEPESKEEPAVPDQPPAPVTVTFINLDITKMFGFKGYRVLYKDNKVMFVADKAFLFRTVQRGNELIWSSKDGYHPDLVIYKEVKGAPKIKVYFPEFKPTDPTPNP